MLHFFIEVLLCGPLLDPLFGLLLSLPFLLLCSLFELFELPLHLVFLSLLPLLLDLLQLLLRSQLAFQLLVSYLFHLQFPLSLLMMDLLDHSLSVNRLLTELSPRLFFGLQKRLQFIFDRSDCRGALSVKPVKNLP